jgi:parvulin-like peptidyl-prolyl isomerase
MAYFRVPAFAFGFAWKLSGWSLLLLAGAALLAGCHPAITDPQDPKFIVAENKDWKITRAELNAEIDVLLKQHQATAAQVGPDKMLQLQTSMLKNMVLKKLILARGAALPLTDLAKDEQAEIDRLKGAATEPEFEQQLQIAGLTLDGFKQRIHEKVVIGKVLEAEAFHDVEPTDQEINDFYLKNKDSITTPPQVRASRILIHVDEKTTPEEKAAKKKSIDKAHERVMHGEDFSKVAMEVSEDRSSAPKGGDIDFFRPGENEPGFDAVAFTTKKGAVSAVFETSLGFQFLKVTDTKEGGEVPLADVRPKIEAYLRQAKMAQQEKDYATKLLTDSGVIYHVVLVDPPAQTAADNAPPPDGSESSAPPSSTPEPASEPAPPASSNAPGQ